jgi:serine/threonine protein kinase
MHRSSSAQNGHQAHSRHQRQPSSALRQAGANALSGNASAKSLQKSSSVPQVQRSHHKDSRPADGALRTEVANRSQDRARAEGANLLDYRPREVRRRVLEILANPDVVNIARGIYQDYSGSNRGRLGFSELRGVLHVLSEKLGMPASTEKEAERLFKRFDINGDGTLEFPEFLELLLGALRRVAFEPQNLLGRGFFVKKQDGNVWDIYHCEKQLGQGSFATAYQCQHRNTGKQRVVKAVKKSQAKLPVEDIEREILIMRQIDHPHVLRLFEWYEDQGRVYLVIEFLKGGTLREILLYFSRKGCDIQESWSRAVAKQACQAMAYCHSLRLVHKDLKDENIMLLKKDPPFAVIIDLGISEMFSSKCPNSRIIAGTPVTMAPEVWMQNFGPKCDVWSLGCVLFELLAGSLPFTVNSMNPKDWIRAQKLGPNWSLIRSSRPGLHCCQSMLAFNDSQRPTMSACLQHEWFSAATETLRSMPPEQVEPLLRFSQQSTLNRCLFLEIAAKLPIEQASRVVDVFETFDSNRDASLSASEMKAVFSKLGISDEALLKKTFKALDLDGDGVLSFSEFTAGVLLLFKDILDDGLQSLFLEHDRDRDGAINKHEAQSLLARASHVARRRPDELLGKLFPNERTTIRYGELRQHILGDLN